MAKRRPRVIVGEAQPSMEGFESTVMPDGELMQYNLEQGAYRLPGGLMRYDTPEGWVDVQDDTDIIGGVEPSPIEVGQPQIPVEVSPARRALEILGLRKRCWEDM